MKKLLRNLLFPTLFTSIFSGYGTTMLAVLTFLSFVAGFNNNCLANEELLGKLGQVQKWLILGNSGERGSVVADRRE